MRIQAQQNNLGREVKSGVIERFREEKASRVERKAMVKEFMQHDDVVSWKDITLSIFGLLIALGFLYFVAFSLPMLQLFFS